MDALIGMDDATPVVKCAEALPAFAVTERQALRRMVSAMALQGLLSNPAEANMAEESLCRLSWKLADRWLELEGDQP